VEMLHIKRIVELADDPCIECGRGVAQSCGVCFECERDAWEEWCEARAEDAEQRAKQGQAMDQKGNYQW